MQVYSKNLNCRFCSGELEELYDFGEVYLTGVFYGQDEVVPVAPISYSRCVDCGLNQLSQNYDPAYLYGESYGYESNLNREMRNHLKRKANMLQAQYLKHSKSSVLDIASNDGTFLSYFENVDYLLGVDPLIDILSDHYPLGANKLKAFFTANSVLEFTNGKKFDLVTSNSVLYDIADLKNFVADVKCVLKDDGIWHFEQSYLPKMVESLSFDTICHEHILYFGLSQIYAMLYQENFSIVDISINNVNGGSIAITAQKNSQSKGLSSHPYLGFLISKEEKEGYTDGSRLRVFFKDIEKVKTDLIDLLSRLRDNKYEIFGLGASTKGNMILQYCQITSELISEIGEVNARKFGKLTPGSRIPIVEESDLLSRVNAAKSAGIVLPWHFRDSIRTSCSEFLDQGGKLIYPLPRLELE